jgi:surfeit locus 1 family protein
VSLRRLFARDRILGVILALAAGGACVRLGIWQLDRLAQRRAFNAQVEASQRLPLLALPAAGDLTNQEYRPVSVAGTYDFSRQIAVRNQFYQGQLGYDLVTPLVISHGQSTDAPKGEAVLIDRGWIPASGNATPADWRKYDVPGTVTVLGVVRLGGPAPSFGGLAEPTPSLSADDMDFWTSVDINRIGGQVPYALLPVYVEQNPSQGTLQPPIAIAPVLDLSDGPHLGYAIQWFGFATLFVVGYPLYVRRQEARSR